MAVHVLPILNPPPTALPAMACPGIIFSSLQFISQRQLRRTVQKHGREELHLAQGQGLRTRVPGCIGTGAAESSCPMSEVRVAAERNYPASKVRGSCRDKLPRA